MGIFKDITTMIKDRAKDEVVNYVKKITEEGTTPQQNEILQTDLPSKEKSAVGEDKQTDVSKSQQTEAPALVEDVKTNPKEEWIPRLISKNIVKLTINKDVSDIILSKTFSSDLLGLSVSEISIYFKLYLFCFGQRKNYGYMGNTLKKKLKLQSSEFDLFDDVLDKLIKRGLISVEQISATQTTFILYIPIDENIMKEAVDKKKKDEDSPTSTKTKKPSSPGKQTPGMGSRDLVKAYNTFVSLEVDKAKMRVGRTNFDKIYMEAIKYIDKTHGFMILSDSDKLKEHLVEYYISAFDIPTFDEWKAKQK